MLFACSDQPANTKEVKKEMASRELKRVTDSEIMVGARDLVTKFYKTDSADRLRFIDSLEIKRSYLAPEEMDAELKELLEAYEYQLGRGGQFEEYIRLRTDKSVEIFHAEPLPDSTVALERIVIPSKVIVKAL